MLLTAQRRSQHSQRRNCDFHSSARTQVRISPCAPTSNNLFPTIRFRTITSRSHAQPWLQVRMYYWSTCCFKSLCLVKSVSLAPQSRLLRLLLWSDHFFSRSGDEMNYSCTYAWGEFMSALQCLYEQRHTNYIMFRIYHHCTERRFYRIQ